MQQIPRELNFRREVLPVVAVGLLLNLLGRQFAASHLQFNRLSPDMPDFLFLDLIGTAFTAVLIGPWWAALVGVLASGVDGLFYTAYFPFGTTSIAAGLVWGYLARTNWMHRALEWGSDLESIRDGVYAYGLLVLAGAVTCDGVSAVTKVVLYGRMGLPLDLGKIYYLRALSLAQHWHLPDPALLSLLGADLLRELADKSLALAVAVAFAAMVGFIPGPRERTALRRHAADRWEQWKTDAPSILLFTITYALFLFMARLGRPVLLYPDAKRPVLWLQDPVVLFLLYLPMLLAAAGFLLLSFDDRSRLGQALESDRRLRELLYRRLLSRRATAARDIEHREWFRALKQESVYGLLASAALWPARLHLSGTFLPVVVYFGAVVAFAVIFFDERRHFAKRWNQARKWMDTLHGWRQVNGPATGADKMLRAFSELMGKDQLRFSARPGRRGQIAYQVAMPIAAVPGWGEPGTGARNCLLLAVVDGDGALAPAPRADLDAALSAAGAQAAIVLTTTPEPVGEEYSGWLRRRAADGCDIVAIGWEDAESALLATTRNDAAGAEWLRWRLRAIEALAAGGAEASTPATPESLAWRALPCVQYLIENLPPSARVVDLGGGRGRHSFAAAAAGHRVLWVERRPELLAELTTLLRHWPAADRIRLQGGDYRQLAPEELDGADLVVLAGVMQHLESREEVAAEFQKLNAALGSGALLYIEMLFDMKFDGAPAADRRYPWRQAEFETELTRHFATPAWRVETARGPYSRSQCFTTGPRSFVPPAQRIDCTSVEYPVTRCC